MVGFVDKPYQTKALNDLDGKEYWAIFPDTGTGKTRIGLRDASRVFMAGKLDALLVLCPDPVKTNWVSLPHMRERPEDIDAVDDHIPEMQAIKGIWISSPKAEDKRAWADFERQINNKPSKLIILVVNYEALLSEHIFDFLKKFCKEFRTMIFADESTNIGKPGARRTKRAIVLGKYSKYRRVSSGTPIIKSPMKIFSQGRFMDGGTGRALGYTSFTTFKARYAILGGFKGKEIIGYQNMEELSDKIASWSTRVIKTDVLDLPPQRIKDVRVDMEPEQMKAYVEMRREFETTIQGHEITASIVLAQMTRLQQILGGYVKHEDQVIEIVPPDRNPKVQATLKKIAEAPGQVIVWFRFREELAAVAALCPCPCYEFHGSMNTKEKLQVRKGFKRGDRRVVLATTATGGVGIDEFKVANTVVRFSRSFDTEKEQQAEDRTYRMGSEIHDAIYYWNVIVPNSVDIKIAMVLSGDIKLSKQVLRDNWRELV